MREEWIISPTGAMPVPADAGRARGQDAETDSVGEDGARVAEACRPTRTVCPGANAAAQSAPRQVTVDPAMRQLMPHALETAVVPGASKVICHRDTVPVAVTSTSAT